MTKKKNEFTEPSDWSLRVVLWTVAAVAGLIAVTLLLSKGIFFYFDLQHQPSIPLFLNHPVFPPEPHLQANPRADLKAYRRQEETKASSYSWVDRSGGIIRIPVDRAMDVLLDEGFPVRSERMKKSRGSS